MGHVQVTLSYLNAQCLSHVMALLNALRARFQASDESLTDWLESYALHCPSLTLTVINDRGGCDSPFVQLSLERINAFVHQNLLSDGSRGVNG